MLATIIFLFHYTINIYTYLKHEFYSKISKVSLSFFSDALLYILIKILYSPNFSFLNIFVYIFNSSFSCSGDRGI